MPLRPNVVYVNFGFWDVGDEAANRARPGYLNRRIERKVAELGGIKSLYSDSFYTEDEFWSIYDRGAYRGAEGALRSRGLLPDLYAKCVRAASAARQSGGMRSTCPG